MTPALEHKTTHVLIVDDEPDIELLIRQRFKRRNGDFQFIFAQNGEEALQRLETNPDVDLVVTDINMPVMDGLSLLARLNGLGGRVIKAVILSAYGDMDNIRRAMNRGAFDFLTKPLDFQDFETTLERSRDAAETTRQGLEARAQLDALHQELDIASRIQSSMLPHEFLAERTDFEIYAEMTPARRVGGDFYDFFMIDEHHLGFAIGDVSGKGIPAALFMAVSRTLLRATALQGVCPADCLEYANRVLGSQGEPGVYTTVFFAILNTGSGEVRFALGGHNPPYRVTVGGELKAIDAPAGMVVGLLPDAEYENGCLQLTAGDSVFLYTDGVTEAMNVEEQFFGNRRLRQILMSHAGRTPKDIVEAVQSSVREYTAGAVQSDDITAMVVKWTPGE